MDEKAKIRISLADGEFEISGSEEFVSTQIENFKNVIKETIENYPKGNFQSSNQENRNETIQSGNSNNEFEKYQFIYDYDDEEIKILKRIPGDSVRERMVNAALLYLYGKSLKFDDQKAPFSKIREVCEDHGFLDSNNFSSALNSANEYLNCSGSGRSQEAKLTYPGKEEAKKLAETILEDES